MTGVDIHAVAADDLRRTCEALHERGGRMQMAYGWEPEPGRVEVRYLATPGDREGFELWRCDASAGSLPSLADSAPMLSWYEREIRDLFGVQFDDHPQPVPLVLHEGVRPRCPPLLRSHRVDEPLPFSRAPWHEPALEAEDVQRLPFGPVRADVMESAQFVFYYLGEGILHYYPRLFFKHRGLEKRFEGMRADLGVVLAERVSGVGSLCHALAYCQAIEAAARCVVPPRARWARSLLAELERLYNHLHYFALLADATTLKVGNAQGRLLEERAKQINARLTGSRFLRNVLTPGGLRRDLRDIEGLEDEISELRDEAADYLDRLNRTPSYRDRLIGTGTLSRRVAFDQGATGPVERASGLDRDLRRDHPYAAYTATSVDVAHHDGGDAEARASVREQELMASFAYIPRLLRAAPDGPVRAPCEVTADTEGIGWAEGPRGALYYAVHVGEKGRLRRVKVKSPSFSNWRAFPYTVHGTDMMDYAINEASFGLTIAGCDR